MGASNLFSRAAAFRLITSSATRRLSHFRGVLVAPSALGGGGTALGSERAAVRSALSLRICSAVAPS